LLGVAGVVGAGGGVGAGSCFFSHPVMAIAATVSNMQGRSFFMFFSIFVRVGFKPWVSVFSLARLSKRWAIIFTKIY
jgi:hypothetical protein